MTTQLQNFVASNWDDTDRPTSIDFYAKEANGDWTLKTSVPASSVGANGEFSILLDDTLVSDPADGGSTKWVGYGMGMNTHWLAIEFLVYVGFTHPLDDPYVYPCVGGVVDAMSYMVDVYDPATSSRVARAGITVGFSLHNRITNTITALTGLTDETGRATFALPFVREGNTPVDTFFVSDPEHHVKAYDDGVTLSFDLEPTFSELTSTLYVNNAKGEVFIVEDRFLWKDFINTPKIDATVDVDGQLYGYTVSQVAPNTSLPTVGSVRVGDSGGIVSEMHLLTPEEIAVWPQVGECSGYYPNYDNEGVFDPDQHGPAIRDDSMKYWELQPGSDVMATAIDGLGPVAVTDENAGGVIDDIAHVVSGYVYNNNRAPALLDGRPVYGRVLFDLNNSLATATHDIPEGSIFWRGFFGGREDGGNATNQIAGSGGVHIAEGSSWDDLDSVPEQKSDYAWPYLERYNLKTKTWFPRIKLPIVDSGVREYRYDALSHPSSNPDAAFSVAGPFHLSSGELPIPPDLGGIYTEQWSLLTVSYGQPDDGGSPVAQTERDADGSVTEPASYPEGDYWVLATRQLGASGVCTTVHSAEELGDSLSGSIRATINLNPVPYAAEGGFAGVIDGKLYFGGGDGEYITGKEFFVYDPTTEEFTRLPDFPDDGSTWADYPPYGVVSGKLWLGPGTENDSWTYEPSSGWSNSSFSGVDLYRMIGDQNQGVEINGKLYYVYDRVYVFDPISLMVEAKAVLPSEGGRLQISSVGIGDKIHVGLDSGYFVYNPVDDSWTRQQVPLVLFGTGAEAFTHSYKNVFYSFSGNYGTTGNYRSVPGVYGLTGNLPIEPPNQGAPMTVLDTYNHRNPAATENRFSGLYPDNAYPLVDGELDFEQQKRKQARDESALTRRVSSDSPRAAHPPFTERGPDAAKVLGAIHPSVPAYNSTTHVLTVPTEAHVGYYNVTDPANVVLLTTGTHTLTVTTNVEARPAAGYRIANGGTSAWTYTVA